MSERIKVKMGLIKQNVYLLASTPEPFVDKSDYLVQQYVSQDEVVKPDGIDIVTTVHDYPVTPASVNSYADGTNYRVDPSSASARPAAGRNIGDVAALQELLSKSPEEISAYFASMADKIKQSKSQASSALAAPAAESEVK